jgi:hypothetical protein
MGHCPAIGKLQLSEETDLTFSYSSESLSMLPPCPKIFHGRESELQDIVNILVQDSARIAVLGTGGMGKTSLATAALHHADMVSKYSLRYFVPCQSVPTCAELVSVIADYIGVEKGPNLVENVVKHFMHTPPSLLVLDNVETPWEPVSSRSEVEDFLSLLTDIPHMGLVVSVAFNG